MGGLSRFAVFAQVALLGFQKEKNSLTGQKKVKEKTSTSFSSIFGTGEEEGKNARRISKKNRAKTPRKRSFSLDDINKTNSKNHVGEFDKNHVGEYAFEIRKSDSLSFDILAFDEGLNKGSANGKTRPISMMIEHYLGVISLILLVACSALSSTTSSFELRNKTLKNDDLKSEAGLSGAWELHDLDSSVFLRFFPQKLTWVEAEKICQNHFGHLVKDGDGNEETLREFLRRLPPSAQNGQIWIGMHQNAPDKPWVWTDEISSDYSTEKTASRGELSNNYSQKRKGLFDVEEDNLYSTEMGLCVSMVPAEGFRWNTRYCKGPHTAAFVCQLKVPKWLEGSPCDFKSLNKFSSKSAKKSSEDPMKKTNKDESTTEKPVATSETVEEPPAVFQNIRYYPKNDTVNVEYSCMKKMSREENESIHIRSCTFTVRQHSEAHVVRKSDWCSQSPQWNKGHEEDEPLSAPAASSKGQKTIIEEFDIVYREDNEIEMMSNSIPRVKKFIKPEEIILQTGYKVINTNKDQKADDGSPLKKVVDSSSPSYLDNNQRVKKNIIRPLSTSSESAEQTTITTALPKSILENHHHKMVGVKELKGGREKPSTTEGPESTAEGPIDRMSSGDADGESGDDVAVAKGWIREKRFNTKEGSSKTNVKKMSRATRQWLTTGVELPNNKKNPKRTRRKEEKHSTISSNLQGSTTFIGKNKKEVLNNESLLGEVQNISEESVRNRRRKENNFVASSSLVQDP